MDSIKAGRFRVACVLMLLLVPARGAWPQAAAGAAATPPPAQTEPSRDALGRSTPRGTVVGFLGAARRGENELARQYLNTTLRGASAEDLAHQLFVVLDARLAARLAQLSDAPEGSRANPLAPDQERVGAIAGPDGTVDIVVERVVRPKVGSIWLFSKETLASIPVLYGDINARCGLPLVPGFLTDRRLAGVRLFDWLVLLLCLPALYLAAMLLDRLLTPPAAVIWRRVLRMSPARHALPLPARLLFVTLTSRWLIASAPLSLIVRQLLSGVVSLLTIGVAVWLLLLLSGEVERHIRGHIPSANFAAATSLLRVGRRVVDVLLLFAGVLVLLHHFGVDPTPMLAGLGVGGIAIALAAQKTLENVIAGASLIFDQAVRVGDVLKVGDLLGTVDRIGLRSTRIRTLDRTVVSVPNSQIANMSLETLSARDKFWFHPIVALRYDTSADQLHAVLAGIREMLDRHTAVDRGSVRVRFLRFGAFSLDVEVFAYVVARDWEHFLEIQELLLVETTRIVNRAGTAIALPSQTMVLTGPRASLAPRDSIPSL